MKRLDHIFGIMQVANFSGSIGCPDPQSRPGEVRHPSRGGETTSKAAWLSIPRTDLQEESRTYTSPPASR